MKLLSKSRAINWPTLLPKNGGGQPAKETEVKLQELDRDLIDEAGSGSSSIFHKLMLKKVVEAHEAEKRRIAQDIHDEVEQLLGNAIFRLDMSLLQLHGVVEDKLEKEMQKIREILIESVGSLQHLSHSLRPSLLDHLGLEATLKWFFRTSGIGDYVNLHWRISGLDGRLPADVEISLFRIIQESCNNVIKHSQAENLHIDIRVSNHRVMATINDDGVGFDPRTVISQYCIENDSVPMGLNGMKERAEVLGGRLSISSQPKHGTKVFVEIPLNFHSKEVA